MTTPLPGAKTRWCHDGVRRADVGKLRRAFGLLPDLILGQSSPGFIVFASQDLFWVLSTGSYGGYLRKKTGYAAVACGYPLLTPPPPGSCGPSWVGAGGAHALSRHEPLVPRFWWPRGPGPRRPLGLLQSPGLPTGSTAPQNSRWLPPGIWFSQVFKRWSAPCDLGNCIGLSGTSSEPCLRLGTGRQSRECEHCLGSRPSTPHWCDLGQVTNFVGFLLQCQMLICLREPLVEVLCVYSSI